MPTGGARTRSGFPPDPNALRRDRPNDAETWTTLDAAGRKGRAPTWPLADQTVREAEVWKAMWHTPQAIAWEADQQTYAVAMFVRSLVDAEKPDASAPSRTLVRQQMDALGLTVPGLRANRWRIGEAKPEQRATSTTGRTAGPTARDRLKVVEGGST